MPEFLFFGFIRSESVPKLPVLDLFVFAFSLGCYSRVVLIFGSSVFSLFAISIFGSLARCYFVKINKYQEFLQAGLRLGPVPELSLTDSPLRNKDVRAGSRGITTGV